MTCWPRAYSCFLMTSPSISVSTLPSLLPDPSHFSSLSVSSAVSSHPFWPFFFFFFIPWSFHATLSVSETTQNKSNYQMPLDCVSGSCVHVLLTQYAFLAMHEFRLVTMRHSSTNSPITFLSGQICNLILEYTKLFTSLHQTWLKIFFFFFLQLQWALVNCSGLHKCKSVWAFIYIYIQIKILNQI